MPEQVTALVSADDFVSVVRVHADRVHDLLRRVGCDPDQAVEATESYALALLDAIVNRPETVVDMAGWWFSRVLELGDRLGGNPAGTTDETPVDGDAPTSVLAGTTGETQVRAALGSLPPPERAAVVLRDAYDLAPLAVAVALRRPPELTDTLIARGRLGLMAGYDHRRAPTLDDHSGRPPELTTLSRLADASLPTLDAAPLRRHVHTCTRCEDVVDALARARRLAAGLPVMALPDEARDRILSSIAARAAATLPTLEEVLLAADEEDEEAPLISPLMVIVALAIAAVLGVAIAAATRGGSGPGPSEAIAGPVPSATLTPAFPTGPTTPASASGSPTPSASASASASSTASASATASATAPASSQPAGTARITLSRTSGPNGANVDVTGTGWRPGSTVQLSYLAFGGRDTGSGATATADANGGFFATIAAQDPAAVPGPHTVRATNGSQQATASYLATS